MVACPCFAPRNRVSCPVPPQDLCRVSLSPEERRRAAVDALPHFSVATVGSVGSYKKGGGVLQKNWRLSLFTIQKNSGSILWNIDYEFFTSPRLPVIPRQSSDWRGNPPVEWDLGTMSAYALRRNRWGSVCESIRSTVQPGDFHAGDIGHWLRMTSCARTWIFDREMEARCRLRIAIPFSTGCAAPFRGRLFADRRGNLPMRYGRGETAA